MSDEEAESAVMTETRPRVCVINSTEIGRAYDQLNECELDVMAVLPHLGHVNPALLHEYDVVIVGCTEKMLSTASLQGAIARMSQVTRLVAVVPQPSDQAAALAARAGFHGLVAREVSPVALARTISAVAREEMAFPRGAITSLVRHLGRLGPGRSREEVANLTPRQRQIIELIAGGATDREIAEMLHITESTAHKHVQNALRRAHARTRSQLVAGLRGANLS